LVGELFEFGFEGLVFVEVQGVLLVAGVRRLRWPRRGRVRRSQEVPFGGRPRSGAAGEVVGFSEQASRALVDGGDGGVIEEHALHPGNGEVVAQVVVHGFLVDAFEVAFGHDAAGQRQPGSIAQVLDEIGLSGENQGEVGFGVVLELRQGVELGEDLEAKQRGLVDDEHGFDLLGFGELEHLAPDGAGHESAGVAGIFFMAQLAEDLAVELEDGAAGGGDAEDAEFRGCRPPTA